MSAKVVAFFLTVVLTAADLVGGQTANSGPAPPATPTPAQPGTAASPFVERVNVEVRSVFGLITGRDGNRASPPPEPSDVDVLENGTHVEVLGIDPVFSDASAPREPASAPREPASAVPTIAAEPRGQGIAQYVYIEPAFLKPISTRLVPAMLRRNLDAMLAVGPIEIVVTGSKGPRVFLPRTSDREAIEEALDRLRNELTRSRLSAPLQRGTSQGRRGPLNPIEGTLSPLDVIATQQGAGFIERSFKTLEVWAAELAAESPGILYLANDGFGTGLAIANPDDVRSFTGQDVAIRQARALAELSSTLASLRLTTIPMAMGWDSDVVPGSASGRSAPSTQPTGIIRSQLDGLDTIGQATGGSVVTSESRFPAVVARFSNTYRISYRSQVRQEGEPHRLEIRSKSGRLVITGPRFSQGGTPRTIAAARAIRSLGANSETPSDSLHVGVSVAGAGIKGKLRTGNVQVVTDLAPIAAALDRLQGGRIRVTIAVEVEGSQAFIYQSERDISRQGSGSRWVYSTPLEWPQSAKRIAVGIEELATGARGMALAELPVP